MGKKEAQLYLGGRGEKNVWELKIAEERTRRKKKNLAAGGMGVGGIREHKIWGHLRTEMKGERRGIHR